MKKTFILLLFLFFVLKTYTQKTFDYEKYRKDLYGLSCSNTTKAGIDSSLINLEKIDSNNISNGAEFFNYDLGMVYYNYGCYYKDKRVEYFNKSIAVLSRNISIGKLISESYYMIAFLYDGLNMHIEAKDYLKLYKKYTKKKYWDMDLIKSIEEGKDKIYE